MIVRELWHLLRDARNDWLANKAPRLGAALAYYSAFSLAPLLLVVLAVAGLAFGREAAEGQLLEQIRGMVGEEGGAAIQTMLANSSQKETGIFATVVGLLMLLVGASGLFGQLQDALNTVWGVQPKAGLGVWGFIQDRFLSLSMVLGCSFLLLTSLVVSAALSAVIAILNGWQLSVVGQTINFVLPFLVITVLFAMIYKYLPDAVIAWRDVWLGAAVTSLLFSVGKTAIGLYIGHSASTSTYGAAASFAVLLIWLYYSAQIFLFGAELTKAYANRYGSRIVPTANAEAVTDNARAREGLERTAPIPTESVSAERPSKGESEVPLGSGTR